MHIKPFISYCAVVSLYIRILIRLARPKIGDPDVVGVTPISKHLKGHFQLFHAFEIRRLHGAAFALLLEIGSIIDYMLSAQRFIFRSTRLPSESIRSVSQ